MFMGKQLSGQELLGCLAIVAGLFTCQSAKSPADSEAMASVNATADAGAAAGVDAAATTDATASSESLGSAWARGLRYRLRKLVDPAYSSY